METQLSNLIALAALIISIISLVFSVEARLRDRYKLKCHAYMSTTFGPVQETYDISVEVTNIGRRPISVTEIVYKDNEKDLENDRYPILTPIYGGIVDGGDPMELAENQTKRFCSGDLSREHLLKKTKNIDVIVRDSHGKSYVQTIENEAYLMSCIESKQKEGPNISAAADGAKATRRC